MTTANTDTGAHASEVGEHLPLRNNDERLAYLRACLKDGKLIKFHPFSPECSKSPRDCETHAIDASLLEQLAQENDGAILKPIRIENAVIKGKLSLRYVAFKSELSIINSIFIDEVDLSFATFEHSAMFDHSDFHEKVDLRGAHAAYDLRVYRARFLKDSSFMDVQVDGVFRAEGAQFADVSFRQAKFTKRVLFCAKTPEDDTGKAKQVRFGGRANFADAHIQGEAHFQGALFEQEAEFSGVRIDSSAYFHCYAESAKDEKGVLREIAYIPTCFGGEAYFTGAQIQGTVFFNGAHFKKEVDFERAYIGGNAIFRAFRRRHSPATSVRVRFGEEVKFMAAHVKGNAEFDGACFEKKADFERMEVDQNAYFRTFHFEDKNELIAIEFQGLARFLGTYIKGDAEFSGAQFTGQGEDHKAHFESFRVDGNAFFDDVRNKKQVGPVLFQKLADFTNAYFQNQAIFPKVIFKGEATFTNIDVIGAATFEDTIFDQKTDFISAGFKSQVNFSGANFNARTDFTDVRVDGSALFTKAVFGGTTLFHSARFKSIDITEATFHRPAFSRSGRLKWPRNPTDAGMDLRGAIYDHITITKEDLPGFLEAFYKYKYDRQPYTQLERALNAAGRDRLAGDTYFEGRRAEGQQLWRQVMRKDPFNNLSLTQSLRELPRALFNVFQKYVFRYGVRPYRLIGYSLLVLLLGSIVFSLPGAIERKEKKLPAQQSAGSDASTAGADAAKEGAASAAQGDSTAASPQPSTADAINVSFRLFVPLADMPPGSEWVPSNRRIPLPDWVSVGGLHPAFTGYAAVHRLFGFILIPLGIAALTGLIHRRGSPGR